MLIPLICKQCGGKLEVEPSQVHESGDTLIVLSDQTFTCPQCGTKYVPGEKVTRAARTPSIVIGGDFKGGTIVIGTGNVISKSPTPAQSQESQQTTQSAPENGTRQKTSKKWWQFWKS